MRGRERESDRDREKEREMERVRGKMVGKRGWERVGERGREGE